MSEEHFGEMEVIELIPNGGDIYLTEENREHYV